VTATTRPTGGPDLDLPAPGRARRAVRAVLQALWRHPWILTALAAGLLLVLPAFGGPLTGGDLAAQEFRSWLAGNGALLWDNYWYTGHPLAGYSLVFPPLAALLGTRVLGALTVVASAALFSALVNGPGGPGPDGVPEPARPDRAGRIAALWFAVACLGQLVIGQLPFGLGVTAGLAALVVARRAARPWHGAAAALLAAVSSLASPLAGAFLLMIGLAWSRQAGLRRALPLGGAGAGVLTAWLFGEGGYFPFPLASLLTVLGFCVAGPLLVRDLGPGLRWGLALYATSSLAIFAVPNPVGGNAARLGAVAAGPVAALVLGRRGRWVTLVLVAVPLLCWQLWPIGTALSRSVGDPSSGAGYYAGLNAFLRTQDPALGPVEVPTLRQHWESWYVPRTYPLARGWERQQDLKDNEVLYRDDLTAEQLRDWLQRKGIGFVALADAPLDHWSKREASLLRRVSVSSGSEQWLVPVWKDPHWQVWQVAGSPGLVSGARMTSLGVDDVTLRFDAAGEATVRLHWTPFWRVVSGAACVSRSPDGRTLVRATGPGEVKVAARLTLGALLTRPTTTC
jgi:hypothetical protein